MNKQEHIQAFIASLPNGFRQDVEAHYQAHGDLQPAIALRHWGETPGAYGEKTSHWICDGYTTLRQQAGIIAEALHRWTGQNYEVWSLRPLESSPGPHLLDLVPALKTEPSAWRGERKLVIPQEVSRFAEQWVITHYGIHESHYQEVQALKCRQVLHSHVWECIVQFSQSGEQVTLMMHHLPGGLHVSSLHYHKQQQEQPRHQRFDYNAAIGTAEVEED
jgi:hypothetical protein